MAKSKRAKEETERIRQLPEGDLLELRGLLSREIKLLAEEKDRKIGTLKKIQKELQDRKHVEADRVVVTDHAVVRYLERMEGVDIEAIRRKVVEMARRSVRRDDEFMDDPVTGMVVVRKNGSDSVATVIHQNSNRLRHPTSLLILTLATPSYEIVK